MKIEKSVLFYCLFSNWYLVKIINQVLQCSLHPGMWFNSSFFQANNINYFKSNLIYLIKKFALLYYLSVSLKSIE